MDKDALREMMCAKMRNKGVSEEETPIAASKVVSGEVDGDVEVTLNLKGSAECIEKVKKLASDLGMIRERSDSSESAPISLSKMCEGYLKKLDEKPDVESKEERNKTSVIADIYKKSNMKVIEGLM